MMRVYLRAFEPEDYKTTIEWRKNEYTWNLLVGPKYFVSSEYEKKWVENAIFDNKNIKLAICTMKDNMHIGNIYLEKIDLINRNANIGIIIGDNTNCGKGYGTEAILLMLQYAFYERGLERVFATILESNYPSQKLFKKCGFREEGILRKSVFKNGHFLNKIIVSILRDEFDKVAKEHNLDY